MAGTLVQDPSTGAFTLAPGAGSNPLGTSPSASELGIGGATATGTGTVSGTTGTDPVTAFNNNIASILTQIQQASSAGRANLGGAVDALTNESVGAAGGYNPSVAPSANLQDQTGLMGAFAPAITSLNTQLGNANASMSDLGTDISAIQSAEQPVALSPGESLVTKGGDVLLNGVSYSAQVDPSTGALTLLPTNSLTPGAGGGTSGAGTSSAGTGSSNYIAAIFGASNPVGAYASDTNYIPEISGLYNSVSTDLTSLGPVNATTIQQYINNQGFKNVPVTGAMIANAAATYDIDPALLTTVLYHESDFGTAGAAVDTMNPGNQGNTGTSTQSYSSWSQGVMATAKNLADRIQAAGNVTPSANNLVAAQIPSSTTASGAASPPATSAVGGNFNTASAAAVSKLPQNMQSYAQAGIGGVAYIDNDRVPTNMQAAVTNQAAAVGIPYLMASDVAAVQALGVAQQNMDLMSTAASKTLSNGFFGAVGDMAGTAINNLPFVQGNAFTSLSQFQSYATAAVNALKGLAGSGGGFRITQSEIDTAEANMPESTDTLQHAQQKMAVLQGLIYTTEAKLFPDAPVPITLPDGTAATVPAKNFAAAVTAGAKVTLGGQ